MVADGIIAVHLFGHELGRISMDEDARRSSFQYNADFLESNRFQHIFPATGIIKRTKYVQLFNQFDGDVFKGIPPQFADSLPDLFGSLIFKAWLDHRNQQLSVIEQLAYVGQRGMGALEYHPVKQLPKNNAIDLDEIIHTLQLVMNVKQSAQQEGLNDQSLINIFKIGTSAGGARPKILISENKKTGHIIPGDLNYSDDYNHYLVKLAIGDEAGYPREIVEYCYHVIMQRAGIRVMPAKLIDQRHFATLRFDRQDGKKKHMLTTSGMTGWNYKSTQRASYENLFRLCTFLKISHAQVEELYKRMIFNIVFANTDDHLKNHAFIYDDETDAWSLSPAYDVTFATNPLLEFKSVRRALSINEKRQHINLADVLEVAAAFTIKNPKGIIRSVQSLQDSMLQALHAHDVPERVIKKMQAQWVELI